MRRAAPLLLLALGAGACVHASGPAWGATLELWPREYFEGPRELSVVDAPSEIRRPLEQALRQAGFSVKYVANPASATRPAGTAATRYFIDTEWQVRGSCPGGGLDLGLLRVDVIDSRKNELVLTLATHGRTEGCEYQGPGLFAYIARTLDAAWRRAEVPVPTPAPAPTPTQGPAPAIAPAPAAATPAPAP